MFIYLTLDQVRGIARQASPQLTFPPTSDSIGSFGCLVCLEVKRNGMVYHPHCRSYFCAADVLTMLEEEDENLYKCPRCRYSLLDEKDDNLTTLLATSVNDDHFINRILYTCTFCSVDLPYLEARAHGPKCADNQQQNARIPARSERPRGLVEPVRREVISNPCATDRPEREDRLFIIHLDGEQLRARMISKNWNGNRLRHYIANLAGIDVDKLKIVKFFHRVMSDSDLVSNVANTDGATYISVFTNQNTLKDRSITLNMEQVGPRPLTDHDIMQQSIRREQRLRDGSSRNYRRSGRPATALPAGYFDVDWDEIDWDETLP